MKRQLRELADNGAKLTAAYKLRRIEWYAAKLASRLERAAQQQHNERGQGPNDRR